jgi:hypothetical protein
MIDIALLTVILNANWQTPKTGSKRRLTNRYESFALHDLHDKICATQAERYKLSGMNKAAIQQLHLKRLATVKA